MSSGTVIHTWSLGLCLVVGLACIQKDNNPQDTGFEHRCNEDTGSTDTGSTDTGSTDTGSTDTGSTDTGDTAAVDTGDTAVDTGDDLLDEAMPDWSLVDINPNSPSCSQAISPRDYLQKTSGWYFMHAT